MSASEPAGPPGSAPAPADPFALPYSTPLRVATLPAKKPLRFDLQPDAQIRARIAAHLGISALYNLRLKGEVRPSGRHDLDLEAELQATVEQPCGITLAPVVTQLSEPVRRRYLADYTPPAGDEAEMPEDDSIEPLPEAIDPAAVAVEALLLALPLYPRAPGAELPQAVFAPPGVAPLRDEDLRPFAGLAGLAAKLGGGQA